MSTTRGNRGGLRWAVLAFAAAIGLAALRVGVLTEVAGVRLSARWAMLDFDSGAYYPAVAFLKGENPYDRARFLALYPVSDGFPPYAPLTLLLHLPFALLPHMQAAVAYAAMTVGLTLLIAWMALRVTRGWATPTAVLAVAAVLLLSRPGHWNLVLGQRAALFTVASYLAIYWARTSPWLSGAGIALAMVKPTWGVPLAALMLANGSTAAVGAGVLLTIGLNLPLLAIIAHRAGGVQAFTSRLILSYRQWQEVSDVSPATSSVRIDAGTIVSRFLGHPLSDTAQVGLTLLVLAAAALAIHRIRDDQLPGARTITTGLICAGVLLCGHHVGYDFLLLTAPALGVFFDGIPSLKAALGRWIVLVLLAIPALNWLATESVLNALHPSRPLWLVIASLNGAALVAMYGLYLWLALRWGGPRSAADDPRRVLRPQVLDSSPTAPPPV